MCLPLLERMDSQKGTFLFAIVAVLATGCFAKCTNPSVSPTTYTSPDALFSTETVYSIMVDVKCSNQEQPSLYALVGEQVLSVSRKPGSNSYQVSWSLDHKEAVKGNIAVGFYDDEGATALRKSMRYGEEVTVTPLFTVSLDHRGVKTASIVAPGFIAVVVSLLVWWLANMTKTRLQES